MMAANWIKSTSAMMQVRALAMLVVLAVGGVAMAQTVVVFVNGDPITALDIEQRTKFISAVDRRQPPRQEVLDELINEKLKCAKASAGDWTSPILRSTAAIARHGAPHAASRPSS